MTPFPRLVLGRWAVASIIGPVLMQAARADAATELAPIVVTGRDDSLVGVAGSATEGTIDANELKSRPIDRPGEVLETVPGMIITQHAGGGKANQYYLRGFNLDHGTDFATYVDGVPINLPTHAHGQGYTDLNWVIPELVESVGYEKGVYYADQGDFANAGSARIKYYTVLPDDFATLTAGGLGYERALVAASTPVANGQLLVALETLHYDGAWQVPMNYRRFNGVARYSAGTNQRGYSLSFQGYDGIWLGSEQVPERAIESGLIDPLSSLDPSTGGNTHRYSFSIEWHARDDSSATTVTAYLVQYNLDLYSDFTYFLNQNRGDEIDQRDSRVYAGLRAEHDLYGKFLGRDEENDLGFQIRQDWIGTTLNQVQERAEWNHVRSDHTSELNLAPYAQNKMQWAPGFRTVAGLRGDLYHFGVASDIVGDSGDRWSGAVSPKLSLIFGPWEKTELYVQGGLGFRTNDARGIFSTYAPSSIGGFGHTLAPIIHTRGAEVGVRSSKVDGLQTTVSAWTLASSSELFFDGDSGATVDSNRPGLRYGVEWTNYYQALRWLTIDADFAYSRALFTDDDPDDLGKYIPESVTSVIAAGVSVRNIPGVDHLFGSLRVRQFGPRPLVENDTEKSAPSTVFNFETGYEFSKTWTGKAEILNLLNAHYNDNEYYYSSRLKGESAGRDDQGGYNDHMVHAGDPRSLRVSLNARF